jgi:outer membrane immunogenic protein
MKVTQFAVLAAALSAAAPALAAEDGFTGARLEGRIAWDNLQADSVFPNPLKLDQTVRVDPLDSSVAYGIEAGYDMPLGRRALVGAYAGAQMTEAEICREITNNDVGCAKVKRSAAAGVRAGVIIGPGAMVYAKGGWSMGATRLGYIDLEEAADDDDYEPYAREKTRHGFHLGAGLEVPFGFNVYGKVEYSYTDYGRDRFTIPTGTSAPTDDKTASVHMRRHEGALALGLRF